MTEPAIEFIGAPEAMADLRRWADQLGPAVAKAAEPFGQRVAALVAGVVPHLSGQLAGSLESSSDDDGVSVGYDGTVVYDGWIEFGGSRGRPYEPQGRYLYPSAQEATDEFVGIASGAADDTIGRFSWSTPQA